MAGIWTNTFGVFIILEDHTAHLTGPEVIGNSRVPGAPLLIWDHLRHHVTLALRTQSHSYTVGRGRLAGGHKVIWRSNQSHTFVVPSRTCTGLSTLLKDAWYGSRMTPFTPELLLPPHPTPPQHHSDQQPFLCPVKERWQIFSNFTLHVK